jgi:hypothetical protein
VPGESEEPEEPPEESEEIEGSEEEPDTTPDEPDEPEPEEPVTAEPESGSDAVQDMIDSFEGIGLSWGYAQSSLLYAMNNNSNDSKVSGIASSICLLFTSYFSSFGENFTAKEVLNLSNSSFQPAYSNLYKEFGSLVSGDAQDVNTALHENRIIDAKNLLNDYRAQVESSISSLTGSDKVTYDEFLNFLTVELPNPNPQNESYYNDPRIPSLDYDSPGAALAFANVAVVMMEHIVGQL